MFIDTHSHLDFADFDADRDEVMARAKALGTEKIINIGCSIERSKKSIQIAEKYENVWTSIGIHPTDEEAPEKTTSELIKELESLLTTSQKIVAIGECGLDFFRNHEEAEKKRQIELFAAQTSLAKAKNLPLVIHSREADAEIMEMLKEENVTNAVVHCFTASLEFAKFCWGRGIFTSFTGILCFPAAENVRSVFKECPLELTMLETDSPFLAPPPHRGKRCEPAFVKEVAEKMAEVKGISFSEIEEATTRNAERFFGI